MFGLFLFLSNKYTSEVFMKIFKKYRLIDLISETKERKKDLNLRNVANVIATAVRAKGDLDAKKLKATGNVSVKAGEGSLGGKADIDIKKGTADLSVPIVVKGKQVTLKINDVSLKDKDIFDKEISGIYNNPETGNNVSLTFSLDKKDQGGMYKFSGGNKSEDTSFDISVEGDAEFDISELIPGKFSPDSIEVAGYYNKNKLEGTVKLGKEFKTKGGSKVDVTASLTGGDKKSVGVGVKVTPKGAKKKKPTAAEKQLKKYTKKYFDIDQSTDTIKAKTKKDSDKTKLAYDIEKGKKEIEKLKNKVTNEGTIRLRKHELKSLISDLLLK